MSFRPARVRPPEWALGGASVALLVVVFAVNWYPGTSAWQCMTALGPFAAVVAALGIVAWLLQATHGAPALPVTAVVVELALGLILVIGLIIRFVSDPPRLGGYVGLALAILVVLAAYASLRRDGVDDADAPKWIETLQL